MPAFRTALLKESDFAWPRLPVTLPKRGDLIRYRVKFAKERAEELNYRLAVAAGLTVTFTWPLVQQHWKTLAAALQAGTINAATEMRWKNDIGSITKGKFADIGAVSGDPLADISETERLKSVMTGGEVFRNDFAPGTIGSMTPSGEIR